MDRPLEIRDSKQKYNLRSICALPHDNGFATGSIEGRVGIDYLHLSDVCCFHAHPLLHFIARHPKRIVSGVIVKTGIVSLLYLQSTPSQPIQRTPCLFEFEFDLTLTLI